MIAHPAHQGKVRLLEELAQIRRQLRQQGKSVVVTNGHFDLLHLGHLRYLQQAKELGDCLIVAINGDDSTRRLKGEKRPLIPQAERAELLTGLACVDFVVIFDELTAERVVEALEPDVYVKGGDYAGAARWPEAELVTRQGGQVRVLPFVNGYSTSQLIQRILERYR